MLCKSVVSLSSSTLSLIASLAIGLAGCGGGGGGGSAPASQSISGGGVKGPLANAVVTVYAFDAAQPGFKGLVADDATTDINASIVGLTLPPPIAPPYIMEFTSSPGTTDITTGQFPVITTMRTVITQSLLDGGEQIYATPLTTMAVDIAEINADSNVLPYLGDNDGVTTVAEFEAALTIAASQVVSTLGFGLDSSVDIFDTPPLVDSTTDTSEEQADVAAYRAAVEAVTAIAYEIDQQTAGGDTDSVLAELAADLADGDIDGSAGTEININTLQVLEQDPATLTIPNTTQTVADVQAILVAETAVTGTSTDTTNLTDGSITTTTAPAETNPDIDGDGVLNADDSFPENAAESVDTDGDGIGDNADTDDDNNGILDVDEGTTPAPTATDTDGDGILDSAPDNCINNFNPSQTDTDGDTQGDACDTDDDEDGTLDTADAFPLDAGETTDTDSDGTGDVADTDDDNDGVADGLDAGNSPIDGTACSLLTDCDGDGVLDGADFDPIDPLVTFNFAPVTANSSVTTDEDVATPLFVLDVTDDGVAGGSLVYAITGPSNGVLSGAEPSLTYTPNAEFNGSDSFTFTATDTDGKVSNISTVSITVNAINDVPIFTSTAVTAVNEDAAYTYTAIATDVDTGDVLTLSAPTLPSWLTFTPATGVLSGTPLNADVGANNVTIRVNDGTVDVDQSFVITVTNTNDAPTFTSTAVTAVDEDTAYTYTAIATDVDAGNVLTLSAPTIPGWLTFTPATGVLTGTPSNAEVGVHAVVIQVNDGTVNVNQSFDITVSNTNDAPTFTSTAVTAVDEDVAYTYTATVTDVDTSDVLTLSAPTLPSWLTFTPATGVLSGTPLNADVGANNVTIRVNDGTVDVDQSFVITVTNTNDAPTFTSTAVAAVDEDAAYTYTAIATDVDTGDVLTLSAPTLPSWLTFTPATGVLSGTPLNADVGANNVTIRVNDGTVNVDQSFVITVTNTNDAPTFTSTAVTAADEDAAYTYTAIATDVDVGNVLTLSAPTLPSWLTFTPATGVLAGTPSNAEVGVHAVVIRVNDGTVNVDQSFDVTVTNTNDAPVGNADAFSAGVSTPRILDVLANDTDVDTGDVLSITAVSPGSRGSTISHDGSTVTFTDVTGIEGTETFTYDMSDGTVTISGIAVTMTVTANTPPVANADSAITDEDVAVTTVDVLANDTDGGDGPGALSITAADIASVNGGSVTNHGDGTFTYTPVADFNGSDSFTYTVSDTVGTSVGTVNITVNPVNDAPVAVDDSGDTTAEDTPFTVANVLSNDTDIDTGDVLSIDSADLNSVAGGVVTNIGDGTFGYSPPADFNGPDSFTYTVSDGFLTSVATVFIDVTPVNDAPVAINDTETATVGVLLITGNVLANDTDAENDGLSITAFDAGSLNGGTVTDNGNGTFNYTSAAGYTGSDSFTYTVSDGALTAVGTVNITVSPAGTPIAMTDLLGATEGGLGALESWVGDAGVNEYEYWTDTYDAGTQTFAWSDFAYNYSTTAFEVAGSDADVALNGSGSWVNEGTVRVVTDDNGDGSMTIGIRDEADTVDVEQVKLSAKYVDIAAQPIVDYLDVQLHSAMLDSAAVFGAGAKLISSYTYEMVTDGYLMYSGNWCQTDDPSRYATLNTTSTNTNCNGVDVPTSIDASGFATSLTQLEVATPFVDNDDFSTPDVAVSFGWEGNLNLKVEFAPGQVNVANYYVVDWSGDATTTTSLVATGTYTRDTTVQGVDMIRFIPPAAAYTQFPEVMQESTGYLVAMEGGYARLGDYVLTGSIGSEIDTVLNGHALDDVLANFDAVQALGYNHIDFTGVTAYDLYYDSGVPTWCIDSLAFDGAGGFVQNDYVVCSGAPGSYSGTYSVDATTGVITVTDDVPETFYGKVVGYNETYGAREVCWRLSSVGPFDCTDEGDGLSYQFSDPASATNAMNSLNGVSLCDYETADGSFDSYTDFESVIADCGNEVAVTAAELEGTWVGSWTELDASTTTLTTVYNADGSGTYSEDNSVAGNWDLGEFNWSVSAGRVIHEGTGITPGYTDIIVALADGRQKVYAEDTGWGADLIADGNADGVIFTDNLVKQGGSLACGYESGWDDLAYAGMGAPINPNSFAEYETLLADCHTPGTFTAAEVAGRSFVDGTETMTFTLGGAAGTEADRGTGTSVDVDTFNFEWYVEAATCTGCTHNYLVIYADDALNPTLGLPAGFWLRETKALVNVIGTPDVVGAVYQFMNYAEQSNYSDTDRATGSDAEIWGPSGMVLQ